MEKRTIPRLLIAAPRSRSGKTLVTCGLLELLKRKGFRPGACKCGPDYIDPMFHKYVLGIPGANLDSFFLPPEEVPGVLGRLAQKEKNGFVLIEGVMGYYDGIGGISERASSWEIAAATKTPAVLVLDCKGASLSAAAMAAGFLKFRENSRIGGLILNRVSGGYYDRLAPAVEEETGIPVLGYLPESREYHLESRHLGLFLPGEIEKLKEQIGKLADQMEKTFEMERLLKLAFSAPALSWEKREPSRFWGRGRELEKAKEALSAGSGTVGDSGIVTGPRIAVARDEAFCFYYQENLDLMEQMGAKLLPFSPIHDKKLPKEADGLWLGGGYPEIYAGKLAENLEMRRAVKQAVKDGIPLLAECGGFLYLHRMLEGSDKRRYPMAGVLEHDAYRTARLGRFGYVNLTSPEGVSVKGHEFHYWESEAPGQDWLAEKPSAFGEAGRSWRCMYGSGHQIIGFPHLYYPSNPEFLQSWLLECKKYSEKRQENQR